MLIFSSDSGTWNYKVSSENSPRVMMKRRKQCLVSSVLEIRKMRKVSDGQPCKNFRLSTIFSTVSAN